MAAPLSLCSIIPPLTLEDSCRLEGLLLDSLGGELKFKTLKKLPVKKVKGGGPKQYRIKNKSSIDKDNSRKTEEGQCATSDNFV